jgi:nitric oxide reductase large subunit
MRAGERIGPATWQVAAVVFGVLSMAGPATAYVGPGAGLTAIGSLLALFGAVALAIVGFIWYPVRRLMRKRKAAAVPAAEKLADKNPAQ